MSIGIGLGAFMEGVGSGVQMRDRIDNSNRMRKREKALDSITADTKKAFDQEVAAGTQTPDQFDEFWMKYALPKRWMALMEQGDIAGARALQEWGESDAALKGGRLFSSAMLKAQTGDAAGALQDVIKAGQVKGYIQHGYEFVGQDEIKSPDGRQTIGFRVTMKGPDGKEVVQDVAVGDVPRIVATIANPDAAWQSQQAARTEQKKRATDIADYETKKGIDRKYDKPDAKTDPAERYRTAREDRTKNDLDFAGRSPEEQDRIVREDLAAADRYGTEKKGGPAPSTPAGPAPNAKVMVDQATGKPVPLEARPVSPDPAATGISPDETSYWDRMKGMIGLGG